MYEIDAEKDFRNGKKIPTWILRNFTERQMKEIRNTWREELLECLRCGFTVEFSRYAYRETQHTQKASTLLFGFHDFTVVFKMAEITQLIDL